MKHNQQPMIACGDLNCPLEDWSPQQSPIEDENVAFDVLEHVNITQGNNKATHGSKMLDVIFSNKFLEPEVATDFEKVFSISDHRALIFEPELGCDHLKPIYDCCHSFGAADYDEMSSTMEENPFEPECFTNINQNGIYILPQQNNQKIQSLCYRVNKQRYLNRARNEQSVMSYFLTI